MEACWRTLTCCFGNAFCTFCCPGCPSSKGSTSTRLAYGFLVFSAVIVACVMLVPGLSTALDHIPHFCSNETSSLHCPGLVGYLAVYRLCFGFVLFFTILWLLMINVKTSNDLRAHVQNGFWGIKLLLLLGLIIGSFYIPGDRNQSHQHKAFDLTLMFVGSVGGFLFILGQLLLAIGFVHSWNVSWVDRVETGSKKHGYGLLFFTFLFYALSAVGMGLLCYFYFRRNCPVNITLISLNFLLCLLLSIISVLPRVRAYNSSCGLLQSSFISVYITFFTSLGIRNHPDIKCNHHSVSVFGEETIFTDPFTLVSLLGLCLSLAYLVLSSSRNNRLRKLFLPSTTDFDMYDDALLLNSESGEQWMLGNDDGLYQRVYDDEKGSVAYNYSLFHFMLIISMLYLMMTLTNWYEPTESFQTNAWYGSLWFKIVATWICAGLYIWSCVAPAVFPDRDFS